MQKPLQKLLLIVAMIVVPWVTQGQEFNYTCNFDGDNDTAGWVFVNGTQTNKWYIGTATNNSSPKSLYVSDNNGTSNSYTTGSISFSYAYQEFTLDSGGYALTYDWKCYGESNYDFIRVFLAPASHTLSAGQDPNGGTSAYTYSSSTLPTGFISLTGSNVKLNLQSSWQTVLTEFYVPTSGDWRLVFSWANDGSGGSTPAGAIDNIVFMQPTCPRPTDMVFSNISQTSFDVSWTETGSSTEWLVRVDSAGVTVDSAIVYDTTASFSSRAANTVYSVRVAALCSSSDTSMFLTSTIRTPCGFISSLPFLYDFESDPTGSSTTGTPFVNCWNLLNNGTSYGGYPYVSSSSTYNHTPGGTKGLYWYNTTTTGTYGDYQCVVLPGVDTDIFPINTLQLSFWAKSSSTSYYPIFYVGVMTNPNDINTFTPVDTINIGNSGSFNEFISSLANYTGSGNYLAVKALRASWTAYVDDFKLELIPDCPRVENVTVSNLDINGATISWTETGTANSWTVEYGPQGFRIGDTVATVLNVTDTSVTLTGLSSNTVYDVYITVDCGLLVGGVNNTSFRTLCTYLDSLPFVETFETQPTGSSNTGSPFVNCWHLLNNGTSYGGYPYVSSSSTYNHTPGGSKGLYWYNTTTTGTYGDYQCIVLPGIDTDAIEINTLMLTFWAKSSSTSYYPVFYVGVMTDPTNINTFNPVDTINLGNNTSFTEYTTTFDRYTGFGNFIAVKALRNSWTAYLDDFTLNIIPDCSRPTELDVVTSTVDTVTVIWADTNENNSAWQIAWGLTGFNPDTASNEHLIDVSDTTYSFTELIAGTTYDVYVRTDCSDAYSWWRGPLTVNPGSYNMPFSGSRTITACTVTIYDDGGPSNNYSDNANSQMTIYSADPDSVLEFSGWAYTETSLDQLTIYDGPNASGPVLWQTASTTINETIPTTSASGNAITMAWHTDGSVEYSGFEVNFHCVAAPPCNIIREVNVTNVAGSSALLSWTLGTGLSSNPAYYEIEIVQGGMVVATDTTSISPYWITGLTAGTNYKVRMRGVCPNDEFIPWDSATFHTVCLAGGTVEISGGTSSNVYYPTDASSAYSYTQELYTPSQVGGAMNITGIAYHISSSGCTSRNISLYLGETSQTSFTTLSDYIRDSVMHLVYTGPFSGSASSWSTINFDSVFHYTGVGYLCVGFDDNTGSTGTANFYTDGSGSNRSMHFHGSSNVDPASPSAATQLVTGVQNDIRFISECDTTTTCVKPNVIITYIGSDDASISWAPGLEESSWDLAYRALSDTGWTTDASGWTSTTYTFTGLTPNVTYVFRITPDCGDSAAAFVSGTTACLAQPLPFTQNFDSWPASSYTFPNCWYKGTNYSTNYPYVSTGYAHSGNNSIYMYSSNTSYSYMALPLMAAPIDSLQVSFWLYKSNTSYSHELRVGVMSDPEDISTFTQLAVASCMNLSTWEPFEIPLNNYTGTGGYIAIVSPNNNYSYPYLDDLEVAYISPCPRPRDVETSDITINSALVQWTDTATNNFEIEYGPYGFTHGSGTVITTTDDTVTLTGLTANTPYDVYVRGICASGDTSNWSFAHTFRSACNLLTSLPWADDLETYPTGSSNTGSAFIPCWNMLNNGTSYGGYPYVSSSTSYSHGGGSRGLYWYNTTTTGTYGDYQCVVLPGIDTTVYPINTVQMRFFAKPSSSSYVPVFQLGVMSDPTDITTFQGIDTVTLTSTDWTEIECPFTTFTGVGYYPAIKAVRPTSSWYAYVDDFHLELAPSCSRPNNFISTSNTASSITINWNERNSATEWELAIETSATATPTPDSVVTTHPLTVTGLTTGVVYYMYVRSICGVGDTSEWSDVLIASPGSWNMRANQTDTLYMCGGVIYDEGGANGAYFTGTQDSYIIIMPDASNSLVSVSGTSYTESTYDHLHIYDGIGTGGTEFWNDYGVSATQTFGPFISNSGPITLYFHCDGSVFYDGFSVNVSCVYTACRVGNIRRNSAVPASDSQLDIIWDTNGALYYQVEYGNSGFTLGTGTLLTTYTNHTTLTGLTGLTSYDVYVRSICPGNDTGDWVLATFQTAMCDNVTELYSYSSTMSSTTSSYGPMGTSFYNYGYIQTLIDSAEMAGLTDPINAFAFSPSTSSQGNYYNHIDVYMANVPESNLSGGFILPNSTHVFVPVITDRDMCYTTTGWQLHSFDTTFTWDGHSNVLFVINRRHGSYSSGASFNAHSTSSVRTRYLYQDGSAYSITNPSGGTEGTGNYVGDLKFFSCSAIGCAQPVITGITHTYESATITWTGDGTEYEVNMKESAAIDWPTTDIHVTGNTYTFTGLLPATNYTFRVRQDCTADSLDYSAWVIDGFVTDSLPCLAPDSLVVTAVTNADATFDWSPIGTETAWQIHVWYSGGIDSIYTVYTHPATVGGFTPGITYQATVRPLCGSAHNIIGEWGDTITFTTAICPDVTGLTASVNQNSITLSWTANPLAVRWEIEYGFQGFDQGTGTTVTSSTNTYTFNGLMDDMSYDFHVRAICGTDWYSEAYTSVTATTGSASITCNTPTAVTATVAGNSATVSWTAGAGNISFELEYGTRGFARGSGTSVTATMSPATLTGLAYETDYDVYVRAYCGESTYSDWSPVVSFTTEPQGSEDCDPVTALSASNVTESSALITWTPGNTGDEWEVVLTNAGGTTLSEASTTEHQYQFSSLTPGTAYVAKVRTVCGDGQYSDFVSTSFTTQSVGIDNVEGATCAIFPNPTSGSTTITVNGVSGKVKIAVVDMNGREVASETLDCSGDCAKTMDVDRLAQGAYFVRITGENVSMVRKLIVR